MDPIIDAGSDTSIAVRNNHRSSCSAMGALGSTHLNNHTTSHMSLGFSNKES